MTDDRQVCVDLCCGDGGWTDAFLDLGFRVIGYDVVRRPAYRGELILQDVRTVDGARLSRLRPRVVVASPPCNRFTTVTPRRRDPRAGMVLVRECKRIIDQARPTFWALENVRGAYAAITAELGPPMNPRGMHNASVYLWGNVPPTIIPRVRKGWKRQPGPPSCFTTTDPPSRDSWRNAVVPYPIAHAIAEACLP